MKTKIKLILLGVVCFEACASFVYSSNNKAIDLVTKNTEALADKLPIWMCISDGPVDCPNKTKADFVAYSR